MSGLDWRDDGACTGMTETHGAAEVSAIFFPERGASLRRAKAICAECPVRERCLEHALTQPEKYGVWGGLSEQERRVMRKERGLRGTKPKAVIHHGQVESAATCRRRPEGICDLCRDAVTRKAHPDWSTPDYYEVYGRTSLDQRKRLDDLDEVAS